MEQTILFTDVRSYIVIWSLIVLVFLIVMLAHILRFAKKHPELKHAEDDPKNQDLVRHACNMTMYAFCLMFVWAAGIMFIVGGFKLSGYNWLPLLLILAAMALPLMGIKRKKK